MWTPLRILAASTLLAASMTTFVGTASAAPVVDALAIKNASPSTIEVVRWYGRGWGGRGWGWGAPVLGGLFAGALIGGALAAPYYYGPGPYYYPGPYYPPAPAYYDPAPGGDASAYCAQRFRTYDPGSGTYRGTDGRRHPCP
jgi:BA14K-like protein